MPRGDGTGPMGRGPMTGKGFGVSPAANYGRCGAGPGLGLGLGSRRGFRGNIAADPDGSLTQKEMLQEQKKLLENRLEIISKQLDNL